jgi:hypothetical protein
MKPIQTGSIAAPGFLGLNTQDSSVQLASGFALTANNCVIDQYGRIGARRGWTTVNTTVNSDLGSANPVQFLFEMIKPSGNVMLSAGNNKLFTGTTTMTTATIRNAANNADVSVTITGNHWQGASLPYGDGAEAEPHVYLAQLNHPVLVYHELPVSGSTNPHAHDSGTFGFQRLGDIGTLPIGYTTTDFTPNCSLAAYGRIWLADLAGDRQTVYFSRLLDGSDFQGGDSGSLSLNAVFPNNDKIVALAAHNGFLIVFGRNNIAVYDNPIDVTQLELIDYIPNVGCIARDSVVSTGTDIIFLSDTGVRSLTRVIQEKSLPFRDLSKNVRDELIRNVNSESSVVAIKGVYYSRDAFYLLSLPTSQIVYCFDTRSPMQDGSYRVTKWNKIDPRAFVVNDSKELLIGKPGYIGKYFGHTDNTVAYRLEYFTNHFDFEQPNALKILKKIGLIVIGGSGSQVAVKYGFDYSENFLAQTKVLAGGTAYEYGIGEYNIAEYTGGVVLEKFFLNVGGAGAILQLGVETDINGNPFSIQKIDIGLKQGKVII